MRLCTDHDGAASCLLSTDGACSAPQEPLPWARGEAHGDRRALVGSEQCVVLRHGGGPRRGGLAAGVARALQRCLGRAGLAVLLRPQAMRRVGGCQANCVTFSHLYTLPKQNHKLIEGRFPLRNRLGPLFGYVLQTHIQHFDDRLVIGECTAPFQHLPQRVV